MKNLVATLCVVFSLLTLGGMVLSHFSGDFKTMVFFMGLMLFNILMAIFNVVSDKDS